MTSALLPESAAPMTREAIAAQDVNVISRTMTLTSRVLEPTGSRRRIAIALSSEAPVVRWAYDPERGYYQFLEVLSHEQGDVDLSYARDGLPFCLDHELRIQVGLVEDVRVDEDKIIRGVSVEGHHPDASWVYSDMEVGQRKKVSIGYVRGNTFTETPDPNGGMPTRTYRGWMLYECSSVAVPADYDVGVGRDDARGVVARAIPPATLASTSEETRMKEQENGAAAPTTALPAPAESRESVIARIAKDHDTILGTNARLADWITSGATVEQVREQVNAMYRERNAPATVPGVRPTIEVGADREAEKPFESFAEQLRAIKAAANGDTDKRLLHLNQRGTPTGMGSQVGADGGFLVAPQYSTEIFRLAFDGGQILSRARQIPVSGNTYTMPAVDETARTNGNRIGGVTSAWAGENDTVAASRPRFRTITFNVTKKLIAIGYVTEEQLEDAPATSSILMDAFSSEIRFRLEQSIWSGTGAGQPLGFSASGALVTQAAEGGQTAGTVVAANVTKMDARLLPQARAGAAWFVNQDVLPVLPLMTIGQQPVYLPPGGLSGNQYGVLLGRPVIPVEFASTLGTTLDIVLADFGFYALATKGGTNMQRSLHVRFVNGEETFRASFRADGQPLLNTPITPLNGSNTMSAFVALAAR